MALTEDDRDLLRRGLMVMQARKEYASEIFYEHLFDVAPQTRALFDTDLVAQTEKVMFAMGAVVAQIHDIEACRAMTQDLALRHVGYGVEASHYPLAGEAVMRTLAAVMEEAWTPEMAHAWQLAYDQIAEVMIASAYGNAA